MGARGKPSVLSYPRQSSAFKSQHQPPGPFRGAFLMDHSFGLAGARCARRLSSEYISNAAQMSTKL